MIENAALKSLATVTLPTVVNSSYQYVNTTYASAVLAGQFVLIGGYYTGAAYTESDGAWALRDWVIEGRRWAACAALGERLALASIDDQLGYTDDIASFSGYGESVLSGLGILSYGQMIEVDGKLHVCTNTHFLTSLNGAGWSGVATSLNISPRGLAKAGAGFVIAGRGQGLYTSPTGAAPTLVPGTAGLDMYAVASTGDKVLATLSDAAYSSAFLSIDGGASFNPVVLPNELWGVRVADAIGGGFIVLSDTHLGLSADGESWDVTALSTVPGIAGGEFWTSIAVDGNRFVVTNGNDTGPILVGEVAPPSGPFWTGLINCEVVA